MSVWVPVEEILPPPWSLVLVWTTYDAGDYLGEFRNNLCFTLETGFIDDTEGWHVEKVGLLRNRHRVSEKAGMGLLGEYEVLFWCLIPSPPVRPPSLKYYDGHIITVLSEVNPEGM
jgi:hypothetical protein